MKTLACLLTLVMLQFANVNAAHAQSESTRIVDPMPLLDDELFNMKSIDQYLESVEKTRMKMFETYTTYVMAQLNDPAHGIGHVDTTEAFQDQISAIDAARSYFGLIRNDYTKDAIDKIFADQSTLMSLYGYKGNLRSKNLNRMLSEIYSQFGELNKENISDDLKKSISDFYPALGKAMADSEAGDTPSAYASAKLVSIKISAMYDAFHRLSSSDEIFESALMIEFVNERLISYGQYDSTN